jgi:hypothetical protein
MKFLAILLTVIFALPLSAQDKSNGSDLPLLKGALIQVNSYDPKTRTYEVRIRTIKAFFAGVCS